ncbi:hypothetical protein CTEN210_01518 [Chaetoceros tenuissimus]|uniref:Uncharacterized protein n=1 Tax=Chaetoceros tenuissimus TaxID=426638 RepID=A0AAD3CHR6_9STRA|nr:hypothetical protein CTEN210_01518 [Chaetoceros tenuissimus]
MSLTLDKKRKLSVGLLAVLCIFLFSNVSSSLGPSHESKRPDPRGLVANQADIDELMQEAKIQAEKIAHGEFNVEIQSVQDDTHEMKEIVEESKGRPVMHTFFQPLEEGASDPLLDLWRKEWESNGFETRVLNMQDVESNPAYPEMKAMAEAFFTGKDAGYYNMLCFYRYLAMANVGGGWMSDYDTFPINFPIEKYSGLANDGKFTSFQAHVPSLISASGSEWQRVAELFIKQMPVSTADWKSDMFLLQEVGNVKENDIILYDQGSYVETFLKYKERDVVDCGKYKRFLVLHCSHLAITTIEEQDLVPTYDYSEMDETVKRAKITEIFMDQWREQCGGSIS